VARLATALVFYNRATAAAYVREGWDARRVFVALNALDQAPIRAAREDWLSRPDDLAAFRRAHRLDDGGPTALFVSRLDADNRVDLLLQAAARLRARHPRLNVVIVGKGPDQPNLERLAADLGLADRAHFTGAIYDEARLAPWFLSADVFCYPTNIGLSILHAFGYGLPVVTDAATAAQNPEIEALRDGENGLLYPHGDAGGLAAALDGLFSDRERARRMGREALRTAAEEFTLGRMVDGFEAAARYCASVAGLTPPPAGERGTPVSP
jgi:glycosyltransferase involved in cell wall biosynthesis